MQKTINKQINKEVLTQDGMRTSRKYKFGPAAQLAGEGFSTKGPPLRVTSATFPLCHVLGLQGYNLWTKT